MSISPNACNLGKSKTSVEQMVRDLLSKAIADDLVSPALGSTGCIDPQSFSSGDLIGIANLMADFLRMNHP